MIVPLFTTKVFFLFSLGFLPFVWWVTIGHRRCIGCADLLGLTVVVVVFSWSFESVIETLFSWLWLFSPLETSSLMTGVPLFSWSSSFLSTSTSSCVIFSSLEVGMSKVTWSLPNASVTSSTSMILFVLSEFSLLMMLLSSDYVSDSVDSATSPSTLCA